ALIKAARPGIASPLLKLTMPAVALNRCGHTAERLCRRCRMELAPSTASPSKMKLEGSGTAAACSGVSTTLSMLSLKSEHDIAIFAFKVISSSEMLLPANRDAASVVQLSYFGLKTLVLASVYRSTPTDNPPKNPSTLRVCDPVPETSNAEKSRSSKLK